MSHEVVTTPVIYSRHGRVAPVSVGGRLLAVGVAAACLAVLIEAARATPDPRGIGTHESLGMQPCGWVERFNIPCMTCGMTTSFAWFVRGNMLASLYVQPMGTVLAAMTAVAFWGALYVAVTGRAVWRLLQALPARRWLLGLTGFAILAWGWKIAIHLGRIDGWG